MAPAAGLGRDVRGVNRGCGIGGLENQMFAMAIGAIGSILYAGLDGLAVHAFKISLGNLRMTGAASCGDVPMANLRLGVACRKNCMASVTIRAGGGIFALKDCACMNTLEILLDGMEDGNPMA